MCVRGVGYKEQLGECVLGVLAGYKEQLGECVLGMLAIKSS